MTEDEARKIKDPTKIPWDSPTVAFVPGRYYLAIYSMTVPKGNGFPLGGDIMGCIWRFNETPEDWVMTYRFRYYAKSRTDPWDGQDQKSWYAAKMKGSEKEIERSLSGLSDMLGGTAGLFFATAPSPVDVLMLRAGAEKSMDIIIAAKKSWMHMRTEKR